MTLKVTVTEDVSTVSVSGDTTSINLTGEQTEISVVNPATSVTFTPSQSFSSTNVQDALFEAHEMIGQQSNDYSIQLSNAHKFEIGSGSAFLRMYATGSQFGWDASLISSDDLKLVSHGTNTSATFKDTSIEFHDPVYMTGNVPAGEDYRFGYITTDSPNTSARHHYVLKSYDQKVGYIGAVGSGTTAKVFIGEGNTGVAVRSIPFVGAEFTPVDLQGNDEDAFTDLGTSTARFKSLYLSDDLYANNVEWLDGEFTFSLSGFGDDFRIRRDGAGTVFRADYSTCYLYKSGVECLKTISGGVEVTGTTKSDKFYCSDKTGIGVVTSHLDKQLEIGGYDAPTMRFRNYTLDSNYEEGDVVGAIEFYENANDRIKASIQYEKGTQDSKDSLVFRHHNFINDNADPKFEVTSSGAKVHKNFLVVADSEPYQTNIRNTGYLSNRYLEISGKIKPADGIILGTGGDSNTLDDYEEGTWTPTLVGESGGSYPIGSYVANYTKIGNTVHIQCDLNGIDTTGTGITNRLHLAGLPFLPNGIYTAVVANNDVSTSSTVFGVTLTSGNKIEFRISSANGGIVHANVNSTTNGDMTVCCTYKTDS